MVAATLDDRHVYRLESLLVAAFLLSPIAGITFVMTHSALAAIAASMLAWASWNWPAWVLLGLVATAPVMRSWNSAVISPMLIGQIKTVAVLLLGLLWTGRRLILREQPRFPRWLMIYLIAWVCVTALSLLNTSNLGRSLNYLSYVAAGLTIFCVSFELDANQKRQLLWITLGLGGLLGVLVLQQYVIVVYHIGTFLQRFLVEPRTLVYFGSNPLLSPVGHYRPTGTMTHPNAMGFYLAMLMPFATALLGVRALTITRRLWLVAAIGAMGLGLIATDSRGAMLFLFVSIAYLSVHAGYRWIPALLISALLGAGAYLAISPSRVTLVQKLSDTVWVRKGLSGRDLVWKNTLGLLHEAPLFGFGPGNFSHEYVAHFGYFLPNDKLNQTSQIWMIQTLGDRIEDNFHAHNIYLQLAGDIGYGGPLLFLIGIATVIIHSERRSRAWSQGSFRRALVLATASSAIGLTVYGFFDSQLGFTIGSLNLVAGALLAIGLMPGGYYA